MEHTKETAESIQERFLEILQRDEPAVETLTTSPNSRCACSGSGWISSPQGVRQCDCRRDARRKAKLEAIPERYRESCLENFEIRSSADADATALIREKPVGSFFLYGDYAIGKTHLMYTQYRFLVESEVPTLVFSMADLISELRRAECDAEYFSVVLDRVRYCEHFHLFLDDIDKFKVTDFKYEVLFDLIDKIHKRRLGLTVTSNYSLRQLDEYEKLHPAIVARLDQICVAVRLSASPRETTAPPLTRFR